MGKMPLKDWLVFAVKPSPPRHKLVAGCHQNQAIPAFKIYIHLQIFKEKIFADGRGKFIDMVCWTVLEQH